MKSQIIDTTALGEIYRLKKLAASILLNQISGDYINCLEVGIWEERLRLEDGLQQRWNVTSVGVTAKDVFIETFLAVHHKNVK